MALTLMAAVCVASAFVTWWLVARIAEMDDRELHGIHRAGSEGRADAVRARVVDATRTPADP